jgi:hypothetical protein
MLRTSTIGLIVGLVLGYVWVIHGFGTAVLIGLVAAGGWLIGKFISGEIDVEAIRQIFRGR